MSKHIERDTSKLKRQLLALGALVEESVYRAVKAVDQRDAKLAEEVIEADSEIDSREVELEEECLKTLALNQPTGNDLRLIIAVMKMTSDLERIGDQAVNIAWKAHALSYQKRVEPPQNLIEMAKKTKLMLKLSLEALINLQVSAALEVMSSDDEIDVMNKANFAWALKNIQSKPAEAESFLNHLFVSRSLERVADHATNIAEDVVYLVEGGIIRHRRKARIDR